MPARVTAVRPTKAIEGGRIVLEGAQFSVDGPRLPEVQIGGAPARLVHASSSSLAVIVPAGLDGGPTPVRIEGVRGGTLFIDVAAPLATGLHQVDNPAFDRDGNLYVTYSGTRGQQVPVSIFKVRPNGARETFSSGIVNATSMAVDDSGRLYVSSRFEGTVYRVAVDGSFEAFATDLGIACGLAFSRSGDLYVGDRSGTIFKVDPSGKAEAFATLPSSVAAFHLAIAPDGVIWATAPTLSTYDPIYKVAPDGTVGILNVKFGRPQGIAFNPSGDAFVVEALAGASGVYHVAGDSSSELVLAGPNLIGIAFDSFGTMVVCSNETAYRLK
jgi:sugar lactone lactonase YvrE